MISFLNSQSSVSVKDPYYEAGTESHIDKHVNFDYIETKHICSPVTFTEDLDKSLLGNVP